MSFGNFLIVITSHYLFHLLQWAHPSGKTLHDQTVFVVFKSGFFLGQNDFLVFTQKLAILSRVLVEWER